MTENAPGPIAETTLELRSTVAGDGTVTVAVGETSVRSPRDHEVTVRIEAAPINPSDLGVLFARADLSTVRAADGDRIGVTVECGRPLDDVVLRSYCIGAAHMAYSWVTSESLTVDADGDVLDLTIRSFGIVRAVDMPHVDVTIQPSEASPVNGSDAVFAAVAAAVWRHHGHHPVWPVLGSGA